MAQIDWITWRWPLYICLFAATIGAYWGGLWLYKKTNSGFLHPLLTSVAVLIIFLLFTGIPYDIYATATEPIQQMLGPTVVALGYALYQQSAYLKRNKYSIFTSTVVGALVGVLSVMGVLWLFDATPDIVASLQPKSVTNPIAIPISERAGGIGALTAVVVVATGILGGIIGPPLLKLLGIHSKIAKGLAMGGAAHGVGTARAMEMGALEGAIAGLAIGLMGLVTALLVPIIQILI